MFNSCTKSVLVGELYYIHTLITPILAYLRSSLKSSLRKLPNSKAIQKMTSLKSGDKMGLMKKLSLFGLGIAIGLTWMIAIIFVGIFASVLQVGVQITFKALAPKFNKISPLTGLKRLFSSQSLADFLKSMAKLAIVGFVGYLTYMDKITELNGLSVSTPEAILKYNFTAVAEVAGEIVLALVAIAIFDYFYQRWHHEQQLMMTKQEVKEETKQTEGDPQLKARIRQIQREMSNARMMQQVPKADALIVNPTHFSVAILYDRDAMSAPEVTAKGADHMALRMRTVARENNVPILERPELARDLYANVEIGEDIPERFYKVIAEILAFVYRLRKK